MPYLIDSDIVIDHLANVDEAKQLLEHLASEGIAMSIITYMEAYVFDHVHGIRFAHQMGPTICKMIIKNGPTQPSVLKSWIAGEATTLRGQSLLQVDPF